MFKLRKRISDLLMEAGLINQQQLDRALILQKNKNKRLGKILVELGYVTEQQIVEALSEQLTLPRSSQLPGWFRHQWSIGPAFSAQDL